jgi:hypothetical protein
MRAVAAGLVLLIVAHAGPVRAAPASPAEDPARSSAADVAEAQRRFRRGLELYGEGDPSGAIAEMKRAYEIAPNFRILYNIGQIHFEMHNYAAALAAFEAYRAQAGSSVPAERRRQIEQDIVKLKQRLALLDVVANVPDAEIAIDEERVGITPLPVPVVVSVGRHRISATKAGYLPAQQIIEVAGGDHAQIALELADEHPAALPLPVASRPIGIRGSAAQKTPVARSVPAPARARSHLWVAWAATGGLAASTAVFAGLAWSAWVDLHDERSRLGTTREVLNAKHAKLQTFSVAADICLATTLAAGGLSLYWTLSGAPATTATTALTVSASSIAFQGTF